MEERGIRQVFSKKKRRPELVIEIGENPNHEGEADEHSHTTQHLPTPDGTSANVPDLFSKIVRNLKSFLSSHEIQLF